MRKKTYLICLVLLGVVFINFTSVFAIAFDEDDDGIDDRFEEKNQRKIEIDVTGNETRIESIRKSNETKDHIRVDILLNEFGIDIEFKYRSNLEHEHEFELVFGINFNEIIEFIDINEDGVFNPEEDEDIQKLSLYNFEPVIYTIEEISDDSLVHQLKIQALNRTFTTNIYFSEEFTLLDDSLITPSQAKINIEISNFNYINENSQLALKVGLFSESNYQLAENTEDEEKGYSINEMGATTTFNSNTGYFSWNEFATVDDVLNEISINEIELDEYKERGQKIYLNYPRGLNIYHDTKIGIEGLLKSVEVPFSPELAVVLILVIGAVSVSVVYSVHYYNKNKVPTKKLDKDREKYFNTIFDDSETIASYNEQSLLTIFIEEDSVGKLIQMGNLNITVISENFYDIVNRFDWDENEKGLFIREMLALSPIERESILDEMIRKSNLNL